MKRLFSCLIVALLLVSCAGIVAPSASAAELAPLNGTVRWLVEPTYEFDDAFYGFYDGMIKVRKAVENGFVCGFINDKGELAIPLKYDWALAFHDGIASVTIDGRDNAIDKTGKILFTLPDNLRFSYSGTQNYVFIVDGLIAVKDISTELYGFIDKTGKIVIDCKYQRQPRSATDFSCFEIEQTYIDSDGEKPFVVPEEYRDYFDWYIGTGNILFDCGVHVIGRDTSTGSEVSLVDKDFNTIIPYGVYDAIHCYKKNLKCGLVEIVKNKKIGLYSFETNEIVIEPAYDGIGAYTKDIFFFYNDGKIGFIRADGTEITPAVYESYVGGEEFFNLDNLMSVRKNGKWGVIDINGNEATPFVFEHITAFSDGLAMAKLDGKWGVLKSGFEVEEAPNPAPAPVSVTANPTASKVLVDGAEISF